MNDLKDYEENFLWLQALQLSPGMLEVYKRYLKTEAESAQSEMDKGVDDGDPLKAARGKGKRDAYNAMLFHVTSRTS